MVQLGRRVIIAKSLDDIIGEANAVYQDSLVQRQQHEAEAIAFLSSKEVLATLIALRIKELYDAAADDEANLRRIVAGLRFTIDDLEAVRRHLQSLRPVNRLGRLKVWQGFKTLRGPVLPDVEHSGAQQKPQV